MSTPHASFDVATEGDVTIVTMKELRLIEPPVTDKFYGELLSYLKTDGASSTRLILSFEKVLFVSSNFLGILRRVLKYATETKRQLRLSDMSAGIREVFRVTGLARLFKIFPTAAEARDAPWDRCRQPA